RLKRYVAENPVVDPGLHTRHHVLAINVAVDLGLARRCEAHHGVLFAAHRFRLRRDVARYGGRAQESVWRQPYFRRLCPRAVRIQHDRLRRTRRQPATLAIRRILAKLAIGPPSGRFVVDRPRIALIWPYGPALARIERLSEGVLRSRARKRNALQTVA